MAENIPEYWRLSESWMMHICIAFDNIQIDRLVAVMICAQLGGNRTMPLCILAGRHQGSKSAGPPAKCRLFQAWAGKNSFWASKIYTCYIHSWCFLGIRAGMCTILILIPGCHTNEVFIKGWMHALLSDHRNTLLHAAEATLKEIYKSKKAESLLGYPYL